MVFCLEARVRKVVARLPRRYVVVSSFVAGLLVCLCAGTLYGASVFAQPMTDLLGYQGKGPMNTAISVGDIGLYLGFIGGFVYDKLGAQLTLVASGVAICFGYVMMYGAAEGWFVTPWPLLAFFMFMVGQGSYAAFTAAYATSAKNIAPRFRGIVIGLMVAAFAASSAIFAQIYQYALSEPKVVGENVAVYLLLMAVLCGGIFVLAALFVCRLPEEKGTSIMTDSRGELLVQGDEEEDTELEDGVRGVYMLVHLNFWLVFAIMFFCTGSGLMWINNQNGLAAALGLPRGFSSNLVLVLAAGSIVGRLMLGGISDALQYRVSRVAWIAVCNVVMGATHVAFAFGSSEKMLYVAAFFTGWAYGGMFALVLSLVSLLFGPHNMGTNNGIISLGPAVGGLVYNQIFSAVFDANGFTQLATTIAHHPTHHPSEILCLGPHCFQLSFYITAGSLLAALILSLWLWRRIPRACPPPEFA